MFTEEGSDELTGVDVDLGHAIGAKLGIDFEFEQQAFDGIIPALQAGNFDVTITAMTSSVERMEVLTSSTTRRRAPASSRRRATPRASRATSTSAARPWRSSRDQPGRPRQRRVAGRVRGRGLDPIELSSSRRTPTRGSPSRRQGRRVAAHQAERRLRRQDHQRRRDLRGRRRPGAPNGYDATLNGIGVLKENEEFAKAIQAALQSLIDDGTYEAILDQYGVTGIGIDEATINGAAEAK